MNYRFLNIINSSKPVLVDFYAEWCVPCKEVIPVLKKVKEQMSYVKFIKVDVDKNPFIASHYKINRLPTLMMFQNGKPLWTGEGVYSADELRTILLHRLHGS
jgi:thioredoxin 1